MYNIKIMVCKSHALPCEGKVVVSGWLLVVYGVWNIHTSALAALRFRFFFLLQKIVKQTYL